jgi:hypothetical protein
MMVVYNLPVPDLSFQWPNLRGGKRRYSTSTRNARLFCKS